MGSVKDLEISKKPTPSAMGVGKFHFSDRYSVFDWGEMPDHIQGKGAALCTMGAYCFERLEKMGVKTHYKGLVGANGEVVRVRELKHPSNVMEVRLVNVYKPSTRRIDGKITHDYSVYTPILSNCLIPLEIIYRNGLPEGSSVFRRLNQGTVTLKDLGLDHYPKPGENLDNPIFDVSTKLEETDRYITWKEAQKIASLTEKELVDIKTLLMKADKTITKVASKAGLRNEDGKIELAFDNERELMVVDVIGTLDECRFTFNGVHVSKEVARQFYKKTKWYVHVEEAKKNAKALGRKDWKTLCKSQPSKLDPELKILISELYMAVANEFIDRKLFDTPQLAEVIENYLQYTGEK